MAWIKRNLYFVIGGVVALALMGLAGWFAYSKWDLNNQKVTQLATDYGELKDLSLKNPHPGNNQIDNVKTAKEQRAELVEFLKKTKSHFQPIRRIPDQAKITDQNFASALSRTLEQLQRDAANSSVVLGSGITNFSFSAQKTKISFAPGSLEPLSIQLGEVKAICDVLYAAKVNSLDNIRRERGPGDDGPNNEYLSEKTVTNELAVLTPYEVEFHSFSAELAAVLAGFANSPHDFIVKTIDVKLSPTSVSAEPGAATTMTSYAPTYVPTPTRSAEDAMRQRYGLGPGGGDSRGGNRYGGGAGASGGIAYRPAAPAPTYVAPAGQPVPVATGKGGLPTVLDERQLKVTLNLVLVKLLPEKTDKAERK